MKIDVGFAALCWVQTRVQHTAITIHPTNNNAQNSARHQVLNDIIWRSFGSASIPAIKEPSRLVRQDGKWPDGLTLSL